ncbi:MAG: hypothetical protein WC791_02570 [Candidatus Paceibacterota bacterium]|jgi:hypothetical protein
MENISKQNIRIGVAAIIIVGVVAAFFFGKPAVAPESGIPAGEQVSTSSSALITTPKTTTIKNTNTSTGEAASLSYVQALALYPEKNRIQLTGGTFCQASPTMATFKNGTSIMIDNRSSEVRTITLGTAYTLPGYGFRIIKLSSATLPASLLMDCNKQLNVATVTIQK